jgi:hypothetical protein
MPKKEGSGKVERPGIALDAMSGNMKNVSSLSTGKVFAFLVLSLCLASPARAQQLPNPPTNQDETSRQLLKRLQELEEEVNLAKRCTASFYRSADEISI